VTWAEGLAPALALEVVAGLAEDVSVAISLSFSAGTNDLRAASTGEPLRRVDVAEFAEGLELFFLLLLIN
jgi:hypothetical protein